MIAGARVEVAPYKKSPGDFVLWKPSEADQIGFDSPWSRGRPGWHIECSAMINEHLGIPFDIHGGGCDLMFPHHENEIAQGICATGQKTYCHYWMHNGFVKVNHEKMSKSLGNTLLVHDLIKKYHGEVIRLTLLSSQYRQSLDWCDETVQQSHNILDRMYRLLGKLDTIKTQECPVPEKFLEALCDDLNTPLAIGYMSNLVKRGFSSDNESELSEIKSKILKCADILGILQDDPKQYLGQNCDNSEAINELIAQKKSF